MKLTSKIHSITKYYKEGLLPIEFEGEDGLYATRTKSFNLNFLVIINGGEYPVKCSNNSNLSERVYSFTMNGQLYYFAPANDLYEFSKIALVFHGLYSGYEIMKFSGQISVRDFSKDAPPKRRIRRPIKIDNKIYFEDVEPEPDEKHYTEIRLEDKYYLRNIWEPADYSDSIIYEKIKIIPSDKYPFICSFRGYHISKDGALSNEEIEYLFLDDDLDYIEVTSEEEPVYYRDDRVKIKSDGKYGFVSLEHFKDYGMIFQENIKEYKNELNIPIPFIYDNIGCFGDNRFVVSRNGSKGIINIDGVELTRIKYSDISSEFGHKNILVKDAYSGKYGVLDKKGNELIPTIYSYIEEIKPDKYDKKHHSLYIVVQGDLYGEYLCGVINNKGKIVIPLDRQVLFFDNNFLFVGDPGESLGYKYDWDKVYEQNIKLDDKYASCQFYSNYYGAMLLNMLSLKGDEIACGVSGFKRLNECGIDSYFKIWMPWLSSAEGSNTEVCMPLDSNLEPFFTQTSLYLDAKPYDLGFRVVNSLFSANLLFYKDFEVYDNYLMDKNGSDGNRQCRLFYYVNREIIECWIGNSIRLESRAEGTDAEFDFDNIIIFIRQQEKVGMIYKGKMCIPCEYDNICIDGDTVYLSLKKRKVSAKFRSFKHQRKTEDGIIIRNSSEVLSDKLYKAQIDTDWKAQRIKSEQLTNKQLLWFSADCIVNEEDDYDYHPGFTDSDSYEWTDEDAWDAMTDGQYGDYPGNGWDPESFGY